MNKLRKWGLRINTISSTCHCYNLQLDFKTPFQVFSSSSNLQLVIQTENLTSMGKARQLLPKNYRVGKQLKILF